MAAIFASRPSVSRLAVSLTCDIMTVTSTYHGQICGKLEESVPAEFRSELFLMSNCRSRYEKFHAKKLHARVRSREPSRIPIKELMHVFQKSRKLRTHSRHFPQSSKVHCYTNYFKYGCGERNPFITGLNWRKKHVRVDEKKYFDHNVKEISVNQLRETYYPPETTKLARNFLFSRTSIRELITAKRCFPQTLKKIQVLELLI